MKNKVSQTDEKHLKIIRETIINIYHEFSDEFNTRNALILDVAPEVYAGCSEVFDLPVIETLDICPKSGATYVTDLADCSQIPSNRFDLIFCTEVLEHTDNPFACARSLYQLVKPGGRVVTTTPFNFRIHNPLPDYWRFTEHALRLIFDQAGFSKIEISQIDSNRFLMPIQYVCRLTK